MVLVNLSRGVLGDQCAQVKNKAEVGVFRRCD